MSKWKNNYKKNPKYFWGWLFSLLIFGLFGLWVPIINEWAKEKPIPFGDIIIQGSVSTFSIVILIEGIITDYSLPKSERGNFPLAIISLGLISFHIVFYTFTIYGAKTTTIKWATLLLAIIAFILAIIMYQFRKIDTEESAETILENQKKEIEESAKSPSSSNPII